MAYDGYVSIGEGGSGESGKAVLAEMEILGGKVMKEYNYSHNTDRFTNYFRRLGPLQKAYRHFESRLNAYIPARTSLSRLKIELHSSQCEVGWSILQGVSGYLEELELYHLDNSRPSLSPTPGTFTFERGILSYPWGPISPNFPNLTSLSIYCSSYRRPLNEHITPDISTMPTFENLKTLSVTGDVVMINNVLRIMAVKGKNIRQATIFGETGWSATSSYGAVELLPEQKNLEVLAIYGSQARTLSSKARSTDFLSVTSLLVETGSLLDTGDPHEIIFSPLLDINFCFPTVQHLVFVILPVAGREISSFSALNDSPELQSFFLSFFSCHPSLSDICWLNDYPNDPSTPHISDSWTPSSILARVTVDRGMILP